MNHISSKDVRQWSIVVLLSLIAWFAQGVYAEVREIEARLRSVEQNQAAIMAWIGVEQASNPVPTLRGASKK